MNIGALGSGSIGGGAIGGGLLGGGTLGAGVVGPTSHNGSGGGGGSGAGPTVGGPHVAVGMAAFASIPGPAKVSAAWAGPALLLVGASERWRAARTFRSIWARRDEYMDFVCTDRWRITKKTETRPIAAMNGPTRRTAPPIGADYP